MKGRDFTIDERGFQKVEVADLSTAYREAINHNADQMVDYATKDEVGKLIPDNVVLAEDFSSEIVPIPREADTLGGKDRGYFENVASAFTGSCSFSSGVFTVVIDGGVVPAKSLFEVKFKAPAVFTAGNTFSIGGKSYTVKTTDGKAAKTGLFASGVAVSCVVDQAGAIVNFKAGGISAGDVIPLDKLEPVYDEVFSLIQESVPNTASNTTTNIDNIKGAIAVANESHIWCYSMYGTRKICLLNTNGTVIKEISIVDTPYQNSGECDTKGNLFFVEGKLNTRVIKKISYSAEASWTFTVSTTGARVCLKVDTDNSLWAFNYIYEYSIVEMIHISNSGTEIERKTITSISNAGQIEIARGQASDFYFLGSSQHLSRITKQGTKVWQVTNQQGTGGIYYKGYLFIADGSGEATPIYKISIANGSAISNSGQATYRFYLSSGTPVFAHMKRGSETFIIVTSVTPDGDSNAVLCVFDDNFNVKWLQRNLGVSSNLAASEDGEYVYGGWMYTARFKPKPCSYKLIE